MINSSNDFLQGSDVSDKQEATNQAVMEPAIPEFLPDEVTDPDTVTREKYEEPVQLSCET